MAIIYDYYRIFYYVAKSKSFTRAAKLLMSNQPNITRAMNKLEQELDCKLFVRSNRGVTLTPEGKKLFEHVKIAQEQLEAGEDEIIHGRNLESGFVSIGSSEIALHILLLPVLREYRRKHPHVHIQVTNQTTPQAIEALKRGLVDMAVVTHPDILPKPYKVQPIKAIQEILVAGNNYSELKGRNVSLRQLVDYPFISHGRDTRTYEFMNNIFAECNLTFRSDIEVATTDQILPMVQYELGLGFLPDSFCKDAIYRGEVFQVQLEERIPKRYICLIQDESRTMSIAAKELIQMLKSNVKHENEVTE